MRLSTHLTISEAEAKRFDEVLKNTPFENLTEFLTACIHLLMYGEKAERYEELTPVAGDWIMELREISLEKEKIMEGFFELLHGFAFPVLAMKGRKTVLKALKTDLESEMMCRFGAAPNPRKV